MREHRAKRKRSEREKAEQDKGKAEWLHNNMTVIGRERLTS